MNTRVECRLKGWLGFLALCLLLFSAQICRAQYVGGTFVSATPQSPIALGQSLNIIVVVSNSTDYVWETGQEFYPFSWCTEATNGTWRTNLEYYGFAYTMVHPGMTNTMLFQLDPTNLPGSPGTYQMDLWTSFNLLDWMLVPMEGSPQRVTFTINQPLRFLPTPRPTNNVVRLSWESVVGRTYRLRYRTNLTTAPWLNLGNDIVANASITTATDNPGTARQRYYQVMLLE